MRRHVTILYTYFRHALQTPPQMPSFIISNPKKIQIELLGQKLQMRKPNYRIPRQIYSIQLHMRKIMQRISIHRQWCLFQRRNLSCRKQLWFLRTSRNIRRHLRRCTTNTKKTSVKFFQRFVSQCSFAQGIWLAQNCLAIFCNSCTRHIIHISTLPQPPVHAIYFFGCLVFSTCPIIPPNNPPINLSSPSPLLQSWPHRRCCRACCRRP
mmetsp:Transcript_1049/g.2186  ORF Transcript_1049/g.2186 Transcript_1049/m.2186 type:complete len:209 (+) Transcript_1049:1740-2366(+)